MSASEAHDRRARTPRQELLGSTLSALMALQFAAVVMFGKEVAAGDLPFPMLAIRFAGQAALLFVVLFLLRKPLAPAPGERLPLVLAATIGYGTEAALFFSALNHGKAGAVTLLFYLYPVWVMLVTIGLDRRPPGWRLFVALLLALGGSAVVIVGGGEVEVAPLGILLALATSVAYTAYLITADRTVRKTDPVTAAAWLGAGAACSNVVFSLAFGVEDLPAASSWPFLLGMAVFSAGAFAAMLGGLQLLGAVRNAIIGVMEPLGVAVLATFFLDEPITAPTAIGGVLILGGAILATLVRTTRVREPDV
ncbi:MAG TPA: DMT family transporter [Actinomycetota bacterium]|nr:DMT family transporter [Actinomycetota bacterium]